VEEDVKDFVFNPESIDPNTTDVIIGQPVSPPINTPSEEDKGVEDAFVVDEYASTGFVMDEHQTPSVSSPPQSEYTDEDLLSPPKIVDKSFQYDENGRVIFSRQLMSNLGIEKPNKKPLIYEQMSELFSKEQALEELRTRIVSTAEKEGYQSGYEAGFREGLVSAEKEIRDSYGKEMSDRLNNISNIILNFKKEIQNEASGSEVLISKIVEVALSQLYLSSIAYDQSQILSLVREGLKSLPFLAEGITVHLNPLDASYVLEAIKSSGNMTKFDVFPDASISQGGCIVSTRDSEVNLTIEQRIKEMMESINGSLFQG